MSEGMKPPSSLSHQETYNKLSRWESQLRALEELGALSSLRVDTGAFYALGGRPPHTVAPGSDWLHTPS